jgi:hypothetical protein
MNMISSSLWITYSQMIKDVPLLVRGSSDLFLFSISTAYIISNRVQMQKIKPEIILTYNPLSNIESSQTP